MTFLGIRRFVIQNAVLVGQDDVPYQFLVLSDKAVGLIGLYGDLVLYFHMVFQDSDAAKWIEAAAYSLSLFPDRKLEETVDKLIDIIADAQEPDGYLNTYYTIKDKEKRWTNLHEGHELYCSGHMMEAACAYYEATGKDKLLLVMQKNAEHIYDHFITKGHAGFPGHPEVELALLKIGQVHLSFGDTFPEPAAGGKQFFIIRRGGKICHGGIQVYGAYRMAGGIALAAHGFGCLRIIRIGRLDMSCTAPGT